MGTFPLEGYEYECQYHLPGLGWYTLTKFEWYTLTKFEARWRVFIVVHDIWWACSRGGQ